MTNSATSTHKDITLAMQGCNQCRTTEDCDAIPKGHLLRAVKMEQPFLFDFKQKNDHCRTIGESPKKTQCKSSNTHQPPHPPTAVKNVSIYTLAQLGTESEKQTPQTSPLYKRARAKTFTSPLSVKLASLDSSLKKGYWNSYHCNSILTQDGSKITGKYCNNRWCSVCNRIRTAKLIIGYNKPLSELKSKQFVTLTLPNCKAEELKNTIEYMLKSAKEVQEIFKKRHSRGKQDWQLVGIRKLECTYNAKTDTYHPHFHFLIEGEEPARGLLNEWLNKVPTANVKGQDVRKADKGAELELFKYFSKIVTKTEKGFNAFIEPLDVIFTAMQGKRVFQPVGLKKNVSEDIENIVTEEIEGIDEKCAKWNWYKSDWVDKSTGEVLTGYIPTDSMIKLIDNMIPRPERPPDLMIV